MNLLMMAPLLDSRGELRYFIGAQVDVSGLVKDASDLDAFQQLLNRREGTEPPKESKDELQELSEMFNNVELDTVRRFGGNMHREHLEEQDDASMYHRPRLLIKDPSSGDEEKPALPTLRPEGRLSGVYKHVRMLCSLNITNHLLTDVLVPTHSPLSLTTHLVHFSLPSRPRYPPIPFPRPHRRLRPRAKLCRRKPCRRLTRSNSKDPLALHRSSQPRV